MQYLFKGNPQSKGKTNNNTYGLRQREKSERTDRESRTSPSYEKLNQGPDSPWSLKNPMALLVKE